LPSISIFRPDNEVEWSCDRNIQVIVEIEARALTVERLFMVSERQEWSFGETLEYALDALELTMAKTATGQIPSDLLRPRYLGR
jgi:hypothetical protein